MEYFAHYDKEKGTKQLLKDHLLSVANHCQEQIPPNVNLANINNSLIKKISFWIGYFHDMGKYSQYFQEYLLMEKNSHLKNHAHISACFLYLFLGEHLNELVNKKEKNIFKFLSYLCVRQHHGELKIDVIGSYSNDKEEWENLKIIKENISERFSDLVDDMPIPLDKNIEEFEKLLKIDFIKEEKRNFLFMPAYFRKGLFNDEKWFFLIIYLFSLLIDSDKLDSANIKIHERKNISPQRVIEYLHNKHGERFKISQVDKRELARQTILKTIDSLNDEEIKSKRLFTLTAPTGIGKTLSSLQGALRLQERIKNIEGYIPRIITAIPFINIIEQTQKEYENVFGNDLEIVINHRLADFSAKNSVREDISVEKSLLEVEAWEGDVILTTFVQLFQSLFTGKNRLLKKINKLAGSIVILDEAQAIPEKYMPLIGATLQKIGEYYGTRFIIMTATQPKILEFGSLLLGSAKVEIPIQLLPNYEGYFKDLKRTKFIPILEERMDNDEFLNFFKEKWDGQKSVLVVVNTIKRSIDIYKKFKELVEEHSEEIYLYYLSTNIIPIQRRLVIKQVKDKLDENKTVILVSTQTIEAGVDLDFDMAFRDFAPLDSLIQTAGRVNREGKKGEYLPVYIIRLESDNNYVYNLQHRQATLELLNKYEEIIEPNYGKLVEQYYQQALSRGVDDESKKLWQEGILKLDFSKLEDFKLIDNLGEVIDVFVENDARATFLGNTYEKILKLREGEIIDFDLSDISNIKINSKISHYEKKALLRLIMAKLSDYIIQVRISRLKENRPIEFKARGDVESHLYWIPPGQLEDFYDEDTGFKDEKGDAYVL